MSSLGDDAKPASKLAAASFLSHPKLARFFNSDTLHVRRIRSIQWFGMLLLKYLNLVCFYLNI